MEEQILPTLRAKNCILRPWCSDDAVFLPEIANTRKISWNTSYRFPYPFTLKEAQKYVANSMEAPGEKNWRFAIESKGELIGGCSAYRGEDIQSHTAEIGYWLGVKYWGQGIATEAVSLLIDYMTTQTDVEQLSAMCSGWNPASARVLEKTGFQQEGIRRGAVKKWGKRTDLIVFGMLLR